MLLQNLMMRLRFYNKIIEAFIFRYSLTDSRLDEFKFYKYFIVNLLQLTSALLISAVFVELKIVIFLCIYYRILALKLFTTLL